MGVACHRFSELEIGYLLYALPIQKILEMDPLYPTSDRVPEPAEPSTYESGSYEAPRSVVQMMKPSN
jgi:hypothetical protein